METDFEAFSNRIGRLYLNCEIEFSDYLILFYLQEQLAMSAPLMPGVLAELVVSRYKMIFSGSTENANRYSSDKRSCKILIQRRLSKLVRLGLVTKMKPEDFFGKRPKKTHKKTIFYMLTNFGFFSFTYLSTNPEILSTEALEVVFFKLNILATLDFSNELNVIKYENLLKTNTLKENVALPVYGAFSKIIENQPEEKKDISSSFMERTDLNKTIEEAIKFLRKQKEYFPEYDLNNLVKPNMDLKHFSREEIVRRCFKNIDPTSQVIEFILLQLEPYSEDVFEAMYFDVIKDYFKKTFLYTTLFDSRINFFENFKTSYEKIKTSQTTTLK